MAESPEEPPEEPPESCELEANLRAAYEAERALSPSVLVALESVHGDVPRVLLPDEESGIVMSPLAIGRAPEAGGKVGGRDNYQILGEIARGGMGVVFKGRDTDLGRDIAIKILRRELRGLPESVQRFVEEAQISGQLQHPGIVPVYEMGLMTGERPYFAMKLVKGRTLAEILEQPGEKGLERRRLMAVFEQVCQTVAYAHARRVIHRDLKPGNVMVGAFGEVQVMDWGLAKILPRGAAGEPRADISRIETPRSKDASTTGPISRDGSVMGTPAYMSPEQARGDVETIDERTDVFALGAILCELLTGEPPYSEKGDVQVLLAAREGRVDGAHDRLRRCDGDPGFVQLALHCLQQEPALRPRTAKDVAETIAEQLAAAERRVRHAQIAAETQRERADAAHAQKRTVLAAAGLVGLALVVAAFFWRRADVAQEQARLSRISGDIGIYRASLAAAWQDLAVHDSASARARLARLDERLRGWEWTYIGAGANPSAREPVTPDGLRRSGRTEIRLSPEGTVAWALGEWAIVHRATQETLLERPAPTGMRKPPPGCISGDGRWVAVEKTLFDVRRREEHVFPATSDLPLDPDEDWRFVALSPHGERAVVERGWRAASTRPHEVVIVTLPAGEVEHVLDVPRGNRGLNARPHTAEPISISRFVWVVHAAFVDDETVAVSVQGGDDELLSAPTESATALFDLATGARRWTLSTSPAKDLVRDARGRYVAGWVVARGSVDAVVWRVSDGAEVARFHESQLPLRLALIEAGGETLLAIHDPGRAMEPTARLYSVRARRASGLEDRFVGALGGGGEPLATLFADEEGLVWWATVTGRMGAEDPRASLAPGLVREASSKTVWPATVDAGGAFALLPHRPTSKPGQMPEFERIDLSTGELLGLRVIETVSGEIFGRMAVTADASTVAFTTLEIRGPAPDLTWIVRVQVVDLETHEVLGQRLLREMPLDRSNPGRPDGVTHTLFCGGDELLCVYDDAGRARLLDALDLSTIEEIAEAGVTAIARDASGERIACGHADGVVRVLGVSREGARELFTLAGDALPVRALAFAADNSQLAVGYKDGSVQVHSPGGGAAIAAFDAHTDEVVALAFHPDGTRLASGSLDDTIVLWDTEHWEPVVELRPRRHTSVPVGAVDFTPNGETLVVFDPDGLTLWSTTPGPEAYRRRTARAAFRRRVARWLAGVVGEVESPAALQAAWAEATDFGEEERGALRPSLIDHARRYVAELEAPVDVAEFLQPR
ncbi:MAG: protein kinase [bacterium]|nr:protein kinase [bacterium]